VWAGRWWPLRQTPWGTRSRRKLPQVNSGSARPPCVTPMRLAPSYISSALLSDGVRLCFGAGFYETRPIPCSQVCPFLSGCRHVVSSLAAAMRLVVAPVLCVPRLLVPLQGVIWRVNNFVMLSPEWPVFRRGNTQERKESSVRPAGTREVMSLNGLMRAGKMDSLRKFSAGIAELVVHVLRSPRISCCRVWWFIVVPPAIGY
jgi:hypothetical protein